MFYSDPTVQNMLIEGIENLLIKHINELKSIATTKERDMILIVGPSKAGKSTITNYLRGFEMELVLQDPEQTDTEQPNIRILNCMPNVELAKIGESNTTSETLCPHLYEGNHKDLKIAYVDCPGFGCIRAREEEKFFEFVTMHMAVSVAQSIQAVIVVADYQTLDGDGDTFSEKFIAPLKRFIKNSEKIINSMLFIFTHAEGQTKVIKADLGAQQNFVLSKIEIKIKFQKEQIDALQNKIAKLLGFRMKSCGVVTECYAIEVKNIHVISEHPMLRKEMVIAKEVIGENGKKKDVRIFLCIPGAKPIPLSSKPYLRLKFSAINEQLVTVSQEEIGKEMLEDILCNVIERGAELLSHEKATLIKECHEKIVECVETINLLHLIKKNPQNIIISNVFDQGTCREHIFARLRDIQKKEDPIPRKYFDVDNYGGEKVDFDLAVATIAGREEMNFIQANELRVKLGGTKFQAEENDRKALVKNIIELKHIDTSDSTVLYKDKFNKMNLLPLRAPLIGAGVGTVTGIIIGGGLGVTCAVLTGGGATPLIPLSAAIGSAFGIALAGTFVGLVGGAVSGTFFPLVVSPKGFMLKHEFVYARQIPLLRVEHSKESDGEKWEEAIGNNLAQARYSVMYYSESGANAHASVTYYVEERNHPINKQRIVQLKQKIAQLQSTVSQNCDKAENREELVRELNEIKRTIAKNEVLHNVLICLAEILRHCDNLEAKELKRALESFVESRQTYLTYIFYPRPQPEPELNPLQVVLDFEIGGAEGRNFSILVEALNVICASETLLKHRFENGSNLLHHLTKLIFNNEIIALVRRTIRKVMLSGVSPYERYEHDSNLTLESSSVLIEAKNSPFKKQMINNSRYIRYQVASDGDCGYTSFGITRKAAFTFLQNNINAKIVKLIAPAVQHALLTEKFFNYLKEREIIGSSITLEQIENRSEDLAIVSAYLEYDIMEKQIDAGWAHPAILQALAEIRGLELCIWHLDKNKILTPFGRDDGKYASYKPENPERRIDILFVNENHFELMEFTNQMPEMNCHQEIQKDSKKFLTSSKDRATRWSDGFCTAYCCIPDNDPYGILQLFPSDEELVGLEAQTRDIEIFLKRVQGDPNCKDHGLLLSGPPGTGKTELVKKVTINSGFQCTEFVRGDRDDRLVNVLNARIIDWFADAKKKKQPICLFLDEIETICPEAEDINRYANEIVNLFQKEIDGLRGSQVVFVGATNFPERVKKAMRDRMGTPVMFDLPNKESRKKIIVQSLKWHFLEDDKMIDRVADTSIGWSPRILTRYLNELKQGIVPRQFIQNAKFIEIFEKKQKELEHELRKCYGCTFIMPKLVENRSDSMFTNLVALDQKVESELDKNLRCYLKDPHAYRLSKAKFNYILYGPPGTGKTSIGRAIAQYAQCMFISIDSGRYRDKAREISELFDLAKKSGKAIIFFDEFDAVAGEYSPVRETIQNAMEGFNKLEDGNVLIVIAATNKKESINHAILNRFLALEVPLPNYKQRVALFEFYLKEKSKAGVLFDNQLNSNLAVECEQFAKQSEGFSPRRIEQVVESAVIDLISDTMKAKEKSSSEAIELTSARIMARIAIIDDFLDRHKKTLLNSGKAGKLLDGYGSVLMSKSPLAAPIEKEGGSPKKQIGNNYIRHEVDSDGDCGYTAFGITRKDAFTFLQRNTNAKIVKLIAPAVKHALLTEKFFAYLHRREVIAPNITLEQIENRSEDLAIVSAYLKYDIMEKQIDAGWAHPAILQALAEIRGLELCIWQLDGNEVPIPFGRDEGRYASYKPKNAKERVNILFVNGNHFDSIEFNNPSLETSCSSVIQKNPEEPITSNGSHTLSDSNRYQKKW